MTENSSRIVVVTGVSSGLGAALVPKLIAVGCTVVGCARRSEAIAKLRKEFDPSHHFEKVDVADNASVRDWAAEVLDVVGVPDLLVNNAALINRPTMMWKTDPDEFQELVNVNIVGVANVIRHFVPSMVDRGSGIIVNLSSGWGRTVSPEMGPYCTTKWAIEGLSKSLAKELPRGMACVPLNPGIVNTPMLQICWREQAAAFPTADDWADGAVDTLLRLTAKHNGKSLSVGEI